jgi:hypothetical protein
MLLCYRGKKNKMQTFCNFEVKIKNLLSEWRLLCRMIQKKMWF